MNTVPIRMSFDARHAIRSRVVEFRAMMFRTRRSLVQKRMYSIMDCFRRPAVLQVIWVLLQPLQVCAHANQVFL